MYFQKFWCSFFILSSFFYLFLSYKILMLNFSVQPDFIVHTEFGRRFLSNKSKLTCSLPLTYVFTWINRKFRFFDFNYRCDLKLSITPKTRPVFCSQVIIIEKKILFSSRKKFILRIKKALSQQVCEPAIRPLYSEAYAILTWIRSIPAIVTPALVKFSLVFLLRTHYFCRLTVIFQCTVIRFTTAPRILFKPSPS